ncbi:MAG: SDR family NAD(P)-dependent oxidoreductase [Vallitaleaceae bacterium]|nr:SDR family NAD(P)-dependent oxidoreductase [Vallitaleaceae bacterium]
MVDVKGKWALITGASRGVGYELAHLMADYGCNLILHSRTLEHTEKVEAELKAKNIEVIRVAAELSKDGEVRDMLSTIDKTGKVVDLVFNNAAVQIAYRKEYFLTPIEDYDMSFKINTIAPATICYHFLPKMIEKGFGRIVNTTSGIRNEPEQAGYSASKAALDKITIDLGSRLEGTDVMINLTDPGWCRTDLGGPNAPNDVKDSIPGVAVGAFVDDKKSGRYLNASLFVGLSLEDAVEKVHGL